MKARLNPGIHFIIFIIFAIVYFGAIDTLIVNENIVILSLSLFLIITGLWGNISRMVLLKIPFSEKSYRTINSIIIILGILFFLYGLYKLLVEG